MEFGADLWLILKLRTRAFQWAQLGVKIRFSWGSFWKKPLWEHLKQCPYSRNPASCPASMVLTPWILLYCTYDHNMMVQCLSLGWVGLVNVPKCHQGSGGWSEGGGELTTSIAFFPLWNSELFGFRRKALTQSTITLSKHGIWSWFLAHFKAKNKGFPMSTAVGENLLLLGVIWTKSSWTYEKIPLFSKSGLMPGLNGAHTVNIIILHLRP